MLEDEDQEIIRKLKAKKKSFKELLNQKNIDSFELDRSLQDEF